MLPSDHPLPLPVCPACVRPNPEPGRPCVCGEYTAPAGPWALPEVTRQVGLEGVARARATLERARRLRPARDQLVA